MCEGICYPRLQDICTVLTDSVCVCVCFFTATTTNYMIRKSFLFTLTEHCFMGLSVWQRFNVIEFNRSGA